MTTSRLFLLALTALLTAALTACADQGQPGDGAPDDEGNLIAPPAGQNGEGGDLLTGNGGGDGGGNGNGGGGVNTGGDGNGSNVTNAGPDGCVEGGEEICEDNYDNNCNGMVDEGCTCAVAEKSCYPGNPADLDHPNSACKAGTQACRVEFYEECSGFVLPSAEVCDGIDNDCNGEIDEIPDCVNTPPEAICPSDQNGSPLAYYTFVGDYRDADGDPMASARWTLVERPIGSTASPDPGNRLTTEIFADIQGDYVLELEVTDDRGGVGRCTTRLETVSNDDLRIEMIWNVGATGDRSDVDLHLLRTVGGQWFDSSPSGDDCFFANCRVCDADYATDYEDACRAEIDNYNRNGVTPPSQVMWTAPLDDDDPRLDLDDVEGAGPENININSPTSGQYRLGVHYWDDDGFGDATVTVRIYCGGSLALETEPVALRASGTFGDGATEFWEVADITFDNGACNVAPLGQQGCRHICTRGDAELSGGCLGRQRGVACN